jgi:hypothetical protein
VADNKPVDLSQFIPAESFDPGEAGLRPLGEFTISGRWDDGTLPCPLCGLRFKPDANLRPSVNGVPICDACAVEHLT